MGKKQRFTQSNSIRKYYLRFKEFLFQSNFFYKNYLKLKGFNFSPKQPQNIPWMNTILKTMKDVKKSMEIIKNSKLKPHPNVIEKNWDSLIALNIILQNSDESSMILDAGGQKYSLVLHWLYQFGYNNLKVINLIFKERKKRGKIELIPGDLTKTPFPDNFFDIITCISVIEHGVNEVHYFKEMYRILKKGGLLITSTDFWENKIKINNIFAYSKPVFIYDKEKLLQLLNKGYNSGFKLFGSEIDLKCQDKVVFWRKVKLKFTFLIFCLQKI